MVLVILVLVILLHVSVTRVCVVSCRVLLHVCTVNRCRPTMVSHGAVLCNNLCIDRGPHCEKVCIVRLSCRTHSFSYRDTTVTVTSPATATSYVPFVRCAACHVFMFIVHGAPLFTPRLVWPLVNTTDALTDTEAAAVRVCTVDSTAHVVK